MPEYTNLGHIDRALTNISVAYQQGADAFIADKVFPIVNVTKQSDVYFKYSKGDMFRNEVQERGRGVESAGGDWNINLADPYHCRKYAMHYDITEEERVNYDAPLKVEQDTTEWLAHKMLLKREVDFASKFFVRGVWGEGDIKGAAAPTPGANEVLKFSDEKSDPVAIVNKYMLAMAENSAQRPNFIIMAPDVFYALKNHDAIVDRIKYTQKGIVTTDLIASLFEVEQLYVPWAISNIAETQAKYDEDSVDMNFLYKGSMLLGYKASRPSLKQPSAGYIFAWTGLEGASAYGSRMIRLKMDHLGLGTERLEMEMAYDMQRICADMGTFFYDLV